MGGGTYPSTHWCIGGVRGLRLQSDQPISFGGQPPTPLLVGLVGWTSAHLPFFFFEVMCQTKSIYIRLSKFVFHISYTLYHKKKKRSFFYFNYSFF